MHLKSLFNGQGEPEDIYPFLRKIQEYMKVQGIDSTTCTFNGISLGIYHDSNIRDTSMIYSLREEINILTTSKDVEQENETIDTAEDITMATLIELEMIERLMKRLFDLVSRGRITDDEYEKLSAYPFGRIGKLKSELEIFLAK